MNQHVRYNTFETNSSSVHTLEVLSLEEYELFKQNEIVFNTNTLSFQTKDTVMNSDLYKEYLEEGYADDWQKFLNNSEYTDSDYCPIRTFGGLDTVTIDSFNNTGDQVKVISLYIGDC